MGWTWGRFPTRHGRVGRPGQGLREGLGFPGRDRPKQAGVGEVRTRLCLERL